MVALNEATARQLDFTYEGLTGLAPRATAPRRPGPAPLCVVCGRVPAHLTIARDPGHRPARLCLRCYHAVRLQRRMLRANLDAGEGRLAGPAATAGWARRFRGETSLIVPRDTTLSPSGKYRQLTASRRRAQKAARQALRS